MTAYPEQARCLSLYAMVHSGDEGDHEGTAPQADRGNQAVREVIRFKARKLRGES